MVDPAFPMLALLLLGSVFAAAALAKLKDLEAFRGLVEQYRLLPRALVARRLVLAGLQPRRNFGNRADAYPTLAFEILRERPLRARTERRRGDGHRQPFPRRLPPNQARRQANDR